jgi:hypothetical protein
MAEASFYDDESQSQLSEMSEGNVMIENDEEKNSSSNAWSKAGSVANDHEDLTQATVPLTVTDTENVGHTLAQTNYAPPANIIDLSFESSQPTQISAQEHPNPHAFGMAHSDNLHLSREEWERYENLEMMKQEDTDDKILNALTETQFLDLMRHNHKVICAENECESEEEAPRSMPYGGGVRIVEHSTIRFVIQLDTQVKDADGVNLSYVCPSCFGHLANMSTMGAHFMSHNKSITDAVKYSVIDSNNKVCRFKEPSTVSAHDIAASALTAYAMSDTATTESLQALVANIPKTDG